MVKTYFPEVMDKLYDFYGAFVSKSNIGKNYTIPAQHAQVVCFSSSKNTLLYICVWMQLTNDYGDACDVSQSPYIDNCNYPSGFAMLQFIYENITYANNSRMIASNVSSLVFFICRMP